MNNENNVNPRFFEIVDKATKEVFPVDHLESGDTDADGDMDFIVHMADGAEVVFTRPGYVNETYVVRDRETKLSPDGVTAVEI